MTAVRTPAPMTEAKPCRRPAPRSGLFDDVLRRCGDRRSWSRLLVLVLCHRQVVIEFVEIGEIIDIGTGESLHSVAGGTISLLNEALEVVERTDERWYEAELYRLMAEALITKSDRNDAEGWLRRALRTAQKQDAKLWELRAATSVARLWRDRGKRTDARYLLAPIYGCFTEGFDARPQRGRRAISRVGVQEHFSPKSATSAWDQTRSADADAAYPFHPRQQTSVREPLRSVSCQQRTTAAPL